MGCNMPFYNLYNIGEKSGKCYQNCNYAEYLFIVHITHSTFIDRRSLQKPSTETPHLQGERLQGSIVARLSSFHSSLIVLQKYNRDQNFTNRLFQRNSFFSIHYRV